MAGVAFTAGSGNTAAMDKVGTSSEPTTDERIPYVKLDRGTGGVSDPVDTTTPLPVGVTTDLITVTLSLDTSAYASGDLLADAQEVTAAARSAGGGGKIVSMTIIDEDDQGAEIIVYLTSVSTSWGTENSAPSISDAVARSIQFIKEVETTDYKDLGGVKVAHFGGLDAIFETVSVDDLFVAVVNGAGTPTYTASGMRIVFGFEQN